MTGILHDPVAELTVAGCAVWSEEGARLAHSRLDGREFKDPCLRDLFLVALELPVGPAFDGRDPAAPLVWEIRAEEAARRAVVRHPDVLEVISRRMVLVDSNGHYASRVIAAHEAREEHHRKVLDLADAAEALGFTLVPRDRADA